MNVYVETNFVLELVFEQEQCESCEQILVLAESGSLRLIVPAYCLAEPHEKLTRQARNRRTLQQNLNDELRQLGRSGSFVNQIQDIKNIDNLLIQSNAVEQQRFMSYQKRLLATAEIISLTGTVLEAAASYSGLYDLTPQDALVYSSVLTHLRQNEANQSCFLNRNSRDFDNPTVVEELESHRCKLINRFDHGLSFAIGRRGGG